MALTNWDIGACCCVAAPYDCGGCGVPQANLTVSWVNSLIGNGSATLVFHAPNVWDSGCASDGNQYKILCSGSVLEFQAIYWTAGGCIGGGSSQYCSNLRGAPFKLDQISQVCGASFLWHLGCGINCSNLATSGYSDFTISA